jgi:poly(3-hydroxybutyrate) depolymerase
MFGHPVADPFDQPLQKPMRISQVSVGSKRLQVRCRELLDLPFVTLRAYSHAALDGKSAVLAIPPLSGHFPVLFHDCIVALLENHELYVAEWKNVRHIHLDHGPFSFEDNIDYIVRMISAIGPNLNVIGLCQSAVPTLAAVAAINRSKQPLAPQSLVLLGGPIDPLANPTRVVALLRERSLDWFQSNVIKPVSSGHSGVGRFVYPAHVHLSGLLSYLTRHIIERGELSRKIAVDDGTAPKTHPFMSLYTSLASVASATFASVLLLCWRANVEDKSYTRIMNLLVFLLFQTFAEDPASSGGKCLKRNTSLQRVLMTVFLELEIQTGAHEVDFILE